MTDSDAVIAKRDPLKPLREALLSLRDSGPDGFEGLVGALLGAVVNASFRLADSGTQGGQDGAGDTSAGTISYEAKLYRGKLAKSAVNNKAFEILSRAVPPDLWALAATVGASTQIKDSLEAGFAKSETSLLLLDWPTGDPLPPLALLCAMAPAPLLDFLSMHSCNPVRLAGLDADLAALAARPGFIGRAAEMRARLTAPDLAAPNTAAANRELLTAVFGDAQQAKERFGQPLAPAARFALETIDRADRGPIDRLFTEPPVPELVVVTGDQGCGKSWSVAQAWLAQAEPPPTLFFTAAAAAALVIRDVAPQTLIARSLIEQSGGVTTEGGLLRWAMRFKRWRDQPAFRPRLVVIIDGLNERARTEWALWLSQLTASVARIGGVVIATSRARYFERIERQLRVPCRKIAVGSFSEAELRAVLARRGIAMSEIAHVRHSLENPRILGIALELLDSRRIREARELTIDRLLFEHLRASQSEPAASSTPVQFKRVLADHARAIRHRISNEVADDRLVFDVHDHAEIPRYDIPRDLLPVVQERFFESLEEDESRYRLSEDGLVYSLAVATLGELQSATRNSRPIEERLAQMIEPIATLDKTSEVLFAATLIASVDSQVGPAIGAALLARLVSQQNIDDEMYPAFCGIVRNMPDAALDVLHLLNTTGRQASHRDWLIAALRAARADDNAGARISARIESWLRLYSANPAHGLVFNRPDDDPERHEELEKARAKMEGRITALTLCERAILTDGMARDDSASRTGLIEDVFLLMIGRPLAPFAEALAYWSFGRAINSGYQEPWRDFAFLLRHNRVDWAETRAALLTACACFARPDTSPAGSWALIHILDATGDPKDAARAARLAQSLVEDRSGLRNWRLIEDYCATDPCDPDAPRPDNIDETARRYAALVPQELLVNRWVTEKERFLADAAPGLARFAPESALTLSRAVAADLPSRPSDVAMLGLNWLDATIALLEPATVAAMLTRAAALSRSPEPDGEAGDTDWVVSQYLLVAAFSHIDGDRQLAVLRALPDHGSPLLQLERVFRPADAAAFEAALADAVGADKEHRLMMMLSFAQSSGTRLSEAALARIRTLVDHDKGSVRGMAMELSARYPDREHLAGFAGSGWSAADLAPRRSLERWHGSSVLIAAARQGLLSPAATFSRISPERYSDAARALGAAAAGPPLAGLLALALPRMIELALPFAPPRVAQDGDSGPDRRAYFALEDDDEPLSLKEQMDRLAEQPEAFDDRQKRGWERFAAFEAAVAAHGADLILHDIGFGAVEAIAAHDGKALERLADAMLALPPDVIPRVANLASRIARVLAATDPVRAVALFRLSEGADSYVRISQSLGSIPLTTWDAWHSPASTEMETYWRSRLDQAPSDHRLAGEVLAAMHAGRKCFVEQSAESAIASGQPIAIARALTMLGFLDRSALAETLLAKFTRAKGFIGQAANAAHKAYQRNSWSRIWFGRMAQANDTADFWRHATLLFKIVDARALLWNRDYAAGALLQRFAWSLEKPITRRGEAWKKKRDKTLFGGDRPRRVYLAPEAGAAPENLE